MPLQESDLSFFAQLKKDGTITNYTAVTSANGTLSAAGSSFQTFNVEAVDPNNYPVVSQPTFAAPGNGSVSKLLTNNQAIVTQAPTLVGYAGTPARDCGRLVVVHCDVWVPDSPGSE